MEEGISLGRIVRSLFESWNKNGIIAQRSRCKSFCILILQQSPDEYIWENKKIEIGE